MDAIAGEILQNVDSVYSATGYENDTDETNALGLPPHSIEIVVYGGLDQDIAEAIFRRKAGGIQTYGNKTIQVIGKSGQSFDIRFSRPTTVPVFVMIENLRTNSSFPTNGKELIKAALVQHIGGDATSGLNIGEDVLFMALPGVILSVPGVVDFDLKISSDGSTYGENNITINTREKATTDESKVSVT